MKKLILLLLFTSCAHHKASEKDVDLYCQDLSVLYQKKAVIESNILNVRTTRTPEGGPYKRQVIRECHLGLCKIEIDNISPLIKYEPKSPDADKHGMVAYPSISLAQEEADLRQWGRVYKNVVKYAPVKTSFFLKDKRAEACLQRYPALNKELNFRSYLGR